MVLALGGLGALTVVAALAVAWAVRRTRREDWASSDLRGSTLEFLITIAPFFGGRVERPRPEPPVVTTPRGDDDSPVAREARRLAEGGAAEGAAGPAEDARKGPAG